MIDEIWSCENKKTAKRFLMLSFAVFFSKGASLLVNVIAANNLGVELYGVFKYYNTIVCYFLLALNLGFDVYFLRKCINSELPISKALGIQLCSRGWLSVIFFLILIPFGIYKLGYPGNLILILLSFKLIIFVFNIEWLIRLYENFKLLSVLTIVSSVFLLLFVWFFVCGNMGVAVLCIAFLVSDMAMVVGQWIFAGRHIARPSLLEVWSNIKESVVISLSCFMVSIYYNIDTLMLGIFRSNYEVGLYSAAYTILLAFIFPAAVLYQVYAPRLSANIMSKQILKDYVFHALIIGGALFAILFSFHRFLILKVYGQTYAGSVNALLWLSIDIIPCYLAGAFSIPINLWGFHREYLYIVTFGAIANIIGNYFFIPEYGINAAIATTILSEVLVFVLGAGCIYLKFKTKESS
ncbi:MAG: hypothetical protein UT30_C0014G0011 [Candidatus Uhrbacteria bacterium GW2011_GWF2_39_13]|uniref:Uncharacterized protein n=1 Tax=Candidatus Uhrbacteria bacterium GW2011_GWF2_39_13 TaxID=1618995 RepID=A0A0G0MLH3_9BACT|nr:MAG: hypothetical protein UT30_C0014G0011 [Candidatus Uhrbacteria bacterium GW2011_GWF2_39_13]